MRLGNRRRPNGPRTAQSSTVLLQRLPEPVVTFPQLRVEPDGFFKGRNCGFQVALLPQSLRNLVVDFRVVAVALEYSLEVIERCPRVSFVAQRDAEIHPDLD